MARSASSASGRSFISSLLVGLLWFAAMYLVAVGGCVVQHVRKTYFPAERVVAYTAKKPAVVARKAAPAPKQASNHFQPSASMGSTLGSFAGGLAGGSVGSAFGFAGGSTSPESAAKDESEE